MKKSKSAKSQPQLQNGHALPSKFAKLLDPDATWDKDQLGDVLHWIRQVLGLVCGLVWGAVPLVGAIWIVVFLVLSSGIIYGYYTYILKIDEEEFGVTQICFKRGSLLHSPFFCFHGS
uniref:Rab5-interacting protein n=1 Tax=Ananas comosus var. bracteatus TaxID=296719 RepID=A0A6V7QUC4_ANACO